MIFLTILGVTEILCSFKLVLERKAGKELPESSRLEFLEKFLASSFGLSDSEENTYGLLNSGGIADFLLLKTLLAICQRSWKLSFWEVTDSFVLLSYGRLAASRTFLQWLTAYLNFTLDSEDRLCWYKRKKWFLWTMSATQAAENHWDKGGVTWYLHWWIFTSIPTCTQSQNWLEV